jgi:hypothetical protein
MMNASEAHPGVVFETIPCTKAVVVQKNDISAKNIERTEIHRRGAPDVANIDLKPSVAS